MKKTLRFGSLLLRLLAGLLALVLLAALLFFGVPLLERGDKTAVPGSADWMAALDDSLPLNQITLPGSHDSATQFCELAFFSKCQGLSVYEQLEAGCRYLDIRLGDPEPGEDFPSLRHGFTKCRVSLLGGTMYLSDLLRECYAFLVQHPTETVLFAVKHEYGSASTADFEAVLDGFTAARPVFWLLSDTIPTLGDARGRLVLLRRYPDTAGLGARAGIPLLWENQDGGSGSGQHAAVEDEGSFSLWVQDRYEYGVEEKWEAFLLGMAEARERRAQGDIALHFLSTKGTAAYGHPYAFAQALNPRLAEQGSYTGWIVLDFFSAPLAETIYLCNFY